MAKPLTYNATLIERIDLTSALAIFKVRPDEPVVEDPPFIPGQYMTLGLNNEDPELGFCICGHVYDGPANGAPHDHGPSWAIYGQATGVTEMTDWKIVRKGEGNEPTLVEPVKTYLMKPGDAHLYDVGDVHSPKRDAPVKLIRIEGQNLDRVRRSNIKAA